MDDTLKRINRFNLILGGVYLLASLFLKSFPKTLGIFFGSILMIFNFYLMGHLVAKVLQGGKLNPLPVLLYLAKFALLILVTYLILRWDYINKIFFILGTTVILPSLLLQAMFSKGQSSEEESNKP